MEIQFKAEPVGGAFYSYVPLYDNDVSFTFLGEQIDVLDIKIFEGTERTGIMTDQKGGCLRLQIPLVPEEFSQLEEDPTIIFDIINDFEDESILEGVRFDKWVARGHNWTKDVYAETTHSLKDHVMYTFLTAGLKELATA